ncbi:CorA family divalent cation transporter [Sphingobacterium rhinopitheci]|uniref:CorA family divalent cation transporter n=1 Tax=Sphingobacterium rhinopitheci TaxID=2781960 RepID=UPI001F52223B|nr:CorA family divalent cation transporter [Sphingobacterium rhinopitheci]MCI0921664.1 magnesium transporter CorA [Sphingobacterium rhinopitheci]
MINHVLQENQSSFAWVDIYNPTAADFYELENRFNISGASIRDALEIGHLPKIEEFEDYHFLIIRSVANTISEDSDALTEITDRISIFYGKNFVITSHRNKIDYLERLINTDPTNKKLQSSKAFINAIVSEALKTFEEFAIHNIATRLDHYEEVVFLRQSRKTSLKKMYYLKRQIDLIRSILTFYKDIVDYFHMPEYKNIYTQDLKDSFSRSLALYKNSSENTAQLLSIYFNIESNHTNEIMRLLTIISVFFMPLTFVTGLYGMNFENMPGLKSPYGYISTVGIMLCISVLILYLFKKKRWL